MKKIFKVLFVAFVIIMELFIASAAIITYDIAGVLATDTHTLPHGDPIGQAIVIYDPGLTGAAEDAATKIGYNLQDAGYNVVLAGVKSEAAKDLVGYDVIVVGGPIYGGKPARSIWEYLGNLNQSATQKIGVYGYGSIKVDNNDTAAVTQDVVLLPSNSTLHIDAVVKVAYGYDEDAAIQGFVSRLVA